MKYLREKYAGYKIIETNSLQFELLLSTLEFVEIKKEIADILERNTCPSKIPADLFYEVVDLHL